MSSTEAPEQATTQPGIVAKSYATAQSIWRFKHFIPTVAFTTLNYYVPFLTRTTGYHDSWPLSTALFVSLAQYSSESSRAQRKLSRGEKVDVVEEIRKQRKRIEGLVVPKDLPKNGVIWETEFKVKSRGLEGVLEHLDREENGERTVKAEWSAHDSLFNKEISSSKVLLYFHGGAYCLMSPKTHRPLCLKLSKSLNCLVFSVDYRLSPETKFPGNLHDAVSAYLYLTRDLKISPQQILVGGDSAGGNLSTALLLYLRDHHSSSSPRGGILLSPWLDFTTSFKSWETNSLTDYISMDSTDPLAPQFLFVNSEQDLIHPYVSPSISEAGSLRGLPPLIVLAGGSETLRDEITLFCQRAVKDGVKVRYEIFEGGVHVFVAVMEGGLGRKGLERIKEWDRELDENLSVGGVELSEGFREVVEKLKQKWEEKQANSPRSRPSSDAVKKEEERFIFEEFVEPAPKIELRESAHPLAVKALQEISGDPSSTQKGYTRVIRARRNPDFRPKSFLARLHL
ncbi:hypothetical protein JCM5350_003054 [Sporobolomyces pararoseus]